jgi:peptide/nickel transport system permease protein
VAALAHKLGLDQGVLVRYGAWIGGALRGDLGLSYAYDSPIGPLIAERLAVSAPLALLAMLITTAVALTAGVFAAQRRGKGGDVAVMAASQIGLAVPNFWFAILLVLVFAVHWRIAPSGGFPGWGAGLTPALGALILPALALGLVQAAILTRVTRSALLDVLNEDFIRTARAKGLNENKVIYRHAFRAALVSIIPVLGIQAGFVLGGAVYIETVFQWPGLGQMLVKAVSTRDLLLVQGGVLVAATVYVLVNLLADVAQAMLDPRLKA